MHLYPRQRVSLNVTSSLALSLTLSMTRLTGTLPLTLNPNPHPYWITPGSTSTGGFSLPSAPGPSSTSLELFITGVTQNLALCLS